MTDIDFAFQFDGRGRTAEPPDLDDHVRDLIEQLLFTSAGERVNRPDFGSGVLQLVFAPASGELAATLQYTTQAAIQRWLGDVIDLKDVQVAVDDSTLRVDIVYAIRATGVQQTASFEQPV
jgi:hypothetical protein